MSDLVYCDAPRVGSQEIALLKLPAQGCLRSISKGTGEWTEFELSDVLVVVLPNHPVSK